MIYIMLVGGTKGGLELGAGDLRCHGERGMSADELNRVANEV